MRGLERFREISTVDFEFQALDGQCPRPICLVARSMRTGQTLRLWEGELVSRQSPPYGIGSDDLFVAYYASAELGCHLALGWECPVNVLDLYAEFRNLTNGVPTPAGAGLLGALVYFGLDCIGADEKDSMRDLVMRGGPWTADERVQLLDYCQSDVHALVQLLPKMLPHILQTRHSSCHALP